MDDALVAEYNAGRSFEDKAVRSLCYAPHTSLYFDTRGQVRVCCHNGKYVIGDAARDKLDAIWQSARLQDLRSDLEQMRFGPGCDICAAQIQDGWIAKPQMRRYDEFAVTAAMPEWPRLLEFSISNSCNLECVMCTGQWSSAIRARREKLPPLPMPYTDEFIDSLRPFLPHLHRAKFLGGEPFLIREYRRIWDMMLADGLKTSCHVTTNGTQLNAKIKRTLEALPFSLSISLDGVTKETVESIRVNADYGKQLLNLRWFRDYTRAKRTNLSLTFCMMRLNWHEFGDYCLFGDDWDCPVWVNNVVKPPQFGFYNLPIEKLREILVSMEAQDREIAPKLKRNLFVWRSELDRLRRRCARAPAEVIAAGVA